MRPIVLCITHAKDRKPSTTRTVETCSTSLSPTLARNATTTQVTVQCAHTVTPPCVNEEPMTCQTEADEDVWQCPERASPHDIACHLGESTAEDQEPSQELRSQHAEAHNDEVPLGFVGNKYVFIENGLVTKKGYADPVAWSRAECITCRTNFWRGDSQPGDVCVKCIRCPERYATCAICLEPALRYDAAAMALNGVLDRSRHNIDGCGGVFCQSCMQEHANRELAAGELAIRCPHPGCRVDLTRGEVTMISPEVAARLKRAVDAAQRAAEAARRAAAEE